MSTLTFKSPPQRVCLLRLSAIGDTCHALAMLRAFQSAWPATRFTWVIGKVEAKLMTAIVPEVEFITFDKRAMLSELRRLRAIFAARRFELLLNLQLSFRASLVSTLIRSPIKLGFDRARARELQWLFTNEKIAPAQHEHVLDSFLGFARACGIEPASVQWGPVVPPEARDYAEGLVADARSVLLISPCSSHPLRNWSASGYAALADHAFETHGMRVILVGGRSSAEARMGEQILAASRHRPINQIGKDTLPELLGLMARASLLVSPDSGPAHMAAMAGLPVIGLYAATRTARAGPYLSRASCIDKYDQAALQYFGKSADQLPWTLKIEKTGVMDLIGVEEVILQLDALLAGRKFG
jgi:heptosyltransferase I